VRVGLLGTFGVIAVVLRMTAIVPLKIVVLVRLVARRRRTLARVKRAEGGMLWVPVMAVMRMRGAVLVGRILWLLVAVR
jgi:hypothetical protein